MKSLKIVKLTLKIQLAFQLFQFKDRGTKFYNK